MRFAVYAAASMVAAATVLFRAFHERPNFYSATVYLGQSNACRMILLNMLLLSAAATFYGLQRLLFGTLRAIEIEQLWDKAWYAITETALAMTTFRDEVGGWFFVMFMSLLAGKVWGWIGEGRVETLEQQPPANPRLFHARLITSLCLSELFDALMLSFCVRVLLEDARPGMMVMFAFEFAVLLISSTSTFVRYVFTWQEKLVIKRQTKAKVEERREEIRAARQDAEQLRANPDSSPAEAVHDGEASEEEEVDENEIDVPGWQEKGRYILFLDLATDFLKLVLYIGFFMILLFFSGIPIHMFRDLFVTTRSFLKRINDYLKYRNATRDMNSRYPDATQEELQRDGTCIICREEMRIWQQADENRRPEGAARRVPRSPPDERQRPKKLPCGHILHLGCLRSWLERQQVCPTCRRSVLVPNTARNSSGQPPAHGNAGQHPTQGQPQGGDRQLPQGDGNRQNPGGQRGLRARTFNLGGFRLTFATGNAQQFQNVLHQHRNQNGTNRQPIPETQRIQNSLDALVQGRQRSNNGSHSQNEGSSIQDQIQRMERQIMQEINNLNSAQEQLVRVRALQGELARLRISNSSGAAPPPNLTQQNSVSAPFPGAGMPNMAIPFPQFQPVPQVYDHGQEFSSVAHQGPIGPGHNDLPAGMTLPEGWSLLPLQRASPHGLHAEGHSDQDADSNTVVEQTPMPSGSSQRPTAGMPSEIPAPSSSDAQILSSAANNFNTNAVSRTAPATSSTGDSDAQQGPGHAAQPPLERRHAPSSMPNWSSEAAPSVSQPFAAANLPANGMETGLNRSVERSGGRTGAQNERMSTGHVNGLSQANGSAEAGKGKSRATTVEEGEDDG